MSKPNKTVADIVREMREALEKIDKIVWDKRRHTKEETEAHRIATEVLSAVHITSSEPKGNAAKIREALEAVIKVGYPHNFQREAPHIRGYCYDITKAIEKCYATLAAPPRNCDKCLTPKDAMLAHLAEVYEGEKVEFGDYEWCEFVKWLFAEAEGEVEK